MGLEKRFSPGEKVTIEGRPGVYVVSKYDTDPLRVPLVPLRGGPDESVPRSLVQKMPQVPPQAHS